MKFDQITLNDVPENFAQKFNCAQMVFGHAARYLDIDEDSAVRTAAFFGTGLRRGNRRLNGFGI